VLKGHTDIASKKLAVALGVKRKWAGPNQTRGVLSMQELIEAGGSEAVSELLRAIGV
jgi:hypothetical protein